MSFTLFVPSVAGISDGGSRIVNYIIDWTALPVYEGDYELSFTFVSQNYGLSFNRNLCPTVNWGAMQYAYSAGIANGLSSSMSLGNVNVFNRGGANSYYFADWKQNVPIRISGKPCQNQFQVRMIDITGNPTNLIGAVRYMMTIHFRAILTLPKQIGGKFNSFTVHLSSRNGEALGGPANLNAITQFNIDWKVFSKHAGRFRLSSTFASESLPTLTPSNINIISVDWGAVHDSYIVGNENDFAGLTNSNIISIFRPIKSGLGGHYGYKRDEQVSVILSQLPTRNQFNIKFLQALSIPLFEPIVDFNTNWELILFFEEI